jgi:hypothetical protein
MYMYRLQIKWGFKKNKQKKNNKNEILDVQCTVHSSVIQFYKLAGRFK